MESRSVGYWWTIGLAVLLATVGACKSDDSASSKEGEEATAEAAGSSADESSGESTVSSDQGSESAPSADLYPAMNFGRLSAEKRETFVSVAKAELCPCPQSTSSLHKCLEAADATCPVAKRSATALAKGLQAGLSKTDVQDKLAEVVEKAKKNHEFTLEGVPHKGPKDAPVTIVEFADFECPHCRKAAGLMDEIVEEYDGKVVHYFKYFPLSSRGNSQLAAQAAAAAHMQGKFWPMHDLIFENQRSLSRDKIMGFARRIGLNFEKFKKDLQSKKATKAVASAKQEGNQAGVRGTPAIYVNGREYMGAVTKKSLKGSIETALEAAESEGSKSGGDSADKSKSDDSDEG
jgi:protein-disulfide isomerase